MSSRLASNHSIDSVLRHQEVGRAKDLSAPQYYTRCCINTILPPDDEHRVARNMYRIIIINVLYNVIEHQVGHLSRVVPGCTVSKT